MAKRKKQGNEDKPSLLRLDGKTFELIPTAEYPFHVLATQEYENWITSIVDLKTNTRITASIDKMRRGLFGDWKEVDGVFEMRLNFGSGYRVYYVKYEKVVVILLGGGDKASQQKDIRAAKALWEKIKNAIEKI